jgi:Ig-like domain from next to BRCA1 gene
VFIANERFTLAIYLKNTGTITWQPGYQLKFTQLTNGGDITVQPQADLTVPVAPGGKVEFDLWAFGSETLGDHTWFFELFTDNGKAVPGSNCSFTFTMIHN